jgi:nitrogen regulatory protein PII
VAAGSILYYLWESSVMKKIEAIVLTDDLTAVENALEDLGIDRLVITPVLTHDSAGSRKQVYRGAEYRLDTPKVKLEFITTDHFAGEAVDAVARASSHAGAYGPIATFDVVDSTP